MDASARFSVVQAPEVRVRRRPQQAGRRRRPSSVRGDDASPSPEDVHVSCHLQRNCWRFLFCVHNPPIFVSCISRFPGDSIFLGRGCCVYICSRLWNADPCCPPSPPPTHTHTPSTSSGIYMLQMHIVAETVGEILRLCIVSCVCVLLRLDNLVRPQKTRCGENWRSSAFYMKY